MDTTTNLEQAALDFCQQVIIIKMAIKYGIEIGLIKIKEDPKN